MGESLRVMLAVGLIAVSALGVCIAYRRNRSRKAKVQSDLFQERFAIYRLVTGFYNNALQHSKVTDKYILQLRTKAGTVDFFYREGFDDYIEELIRRSSELTRVLNETPFLFGKDEEDTGSILNNDLAWFEHQQFVIEEKFGKYLHCGFSPWLCPERACACTSSGRLRLRSNVITRGRHTKSRR
jgi:hypothetical protein